MKRVTFDVTDKLKKQLQLLAVEQGQTITQLMLDALENTYNLKEDNKMKKLDIFNGESREITVVTDYCKITIPPHESRIVEVDEDAQFNQGEFYVEEEGSWYIKTKNCDTGCDAEIYDGDANI
jgi:hypothetical protein